MKRYFLFILTFVLAIHSGFANEKLTKFFGDVDSFLKKYTQEGRVDYEAIKKNLTNAQQLYEAIGTMDLSGTTEDERKAFYLNAYNMVVIYQVAKYYPLKSAMDQSGFFDKVKHRIAGEQLTLNALEIIKIMRQFGDARIHFALACAANGCPPLADFAYAPNQIDTQLQQRTRESLNNDNFIQVQSSSRKVNVSMIFKWYAKDFIKEKPNIITYINQFRDNKIPENFELGYYEYDWGLNIQ
ncbi:DUF547 domain-containing protein [Fulvivirgaceae bacterium BMA10]|uniref:DUF547 domain-containing protein n=1 Tax=Splendidivirga corallicola TaxID=3051826 RepID=A0ABT8KWM8_9BACT|nr:DUF547 domain-containing protein [Fulvivirgaceae bacterium BMA10]